MNSPVLRQNTAEVGGNDSIRAAQELLRQDRRQGLQALNHLFRAGGAPDPPLDGPYDGELVALDIAPIVNPLLQAITAHEGKQFEASKSHGDNRFAKSSRSLFQVAFPLYRGVIERDSEYRAFRFQTSVGAGQVDSDRQVFKIDYELPGNPSLSIRRILDEVVQIGEDKYLGKVHFKWWWGGWQFIAYFALRKPSRAGY